MLLSCFRCFSAAAFSRILMSRLVNRGTMIGKLRPRPAVVQFTVLYPPLSYINSYISVLRLLWTFWFSFRRATSKMLPSVLFLSLSDIIKALICWLYNTMSSGYFFNIPNRIGSFYTLPTVRRKTKPTRTSIFLQWFRKRFYHICFKTVTHACRAWWNQGVYKKGRQSGVLKHVWCALGLGLARSTANFGTKREIAFIFEDVDQIPWNIAIVDWMVDSLVVCFIHTFYC